MYLNLPQGRIELVLGAFEEDVEVGVAPTERVLPKRSLADFLGVVLRGRA